MPRARASTNATHDSDFDDGCTAEYAMDELPEITRIAREREHEMAMPWSTTGSDLSFGARSSVIAQAIRGVDLRAL